MTWEKEIEELREKFFQVENEKEKLNSKISLLDANSNAANANINRLNNEILEDKEKVILLKEELEKRAQKRENVFKNKEKFEIESKIENENIEITASTDQVPAVVKELAMADVEVKAVIPKEHTLEEIFFDATKGGKNE